MRCVGLRRTHASLIDAYKELRWCQYGSQSLTSLRVPESRGAAKVAASTNQTGIEHKTRDPAAPVLPRLQPADQHGRGATYVSRGSQLTTGPLRRPGPDCNRSEPLRLSST
ncbi:hypothetical protein Asru_0573_06 [Acidisphaera rubrifaciens HS-AP3]|uniref:Uncharacterized protein n=1 Tax=Acidisphaera rubrifaciens HS-AP3 TaxID=1231350 RepID=A0A0D6P8C6_9PROT|nr:hypothetical protein Asru_0573_06 [Acidisphaera rubrifaciens HS-AP3]